MGFGLVRVGNDQGEQENTDCELPKFPLIFPCLDRSGPGVLIGGGYEFAKHFVVELTTMWGTPDSGSSQFADARADGMSVLIGVNYFGY